jgi:hypothetical protein
MQAIYIYCILTLIIGMIIGSNVKILKPYLLKFNSSFTAFLPIKSRKNIPSTVVIKKNNLYFDELEVRLLKAIITQEDNGLDIASLNTLLNLKKLSEENQRQRRHLFIKELNLKLFLLFGIREGITRIEFDIDKRKKLYVFEEKFDKTKIENLLNVK